MKKVWVLLVSFLLLACTCAVPSIVAAPTPTEAVSVSIPAVATFQPQPQTDSGLTIMRLDPADGDLESQLVIHAAAASALGQHMFVEFDASW